MFKICLEKASVIYNGKTTLTLEDAYDLLNSCGYDGEVTDVAEFDTLEEAREELKSLKTKVYISANDENSCNVDLEVYEIYEDDNLLDIADFERIERT